MSDVIPEFSRLKSVQVVVEERLVALEVTPDTWRTHVFTGVETIPEKLKAAFSSDGDGHDLDLLDLVRKSYKGGRTETRFEVPYRKNGDNKGPTVLRSVVVTLQFRRRETKLGRAPWAGRPTVSGIGMPMMGDRLWAAFELHRIEDELGKRYPMLSENVIKLAVRLVKLDVGPQEGTRKLARRVVEVLERRAPGGLKK